MSYMPISNTGCAGKFGDMMIIINTELCGDWAGNVWNQHGCNGKTGVGSCVDYVRNHGDRMTEAYWTINSLKIYSGSGGNPNPQPTPSPGGSMYCMPKPDASARALGYDLDWACGVVSCSDIPYNCQDIVGKATYIISKVYAMRKGTCDFSGSAHYVDQSQSSRPQCLYKGRSVTADRLVKAASE